MRKTLQRLFNFNNGWKAKTFQYKAKNSNSSWKLLMKKSPQETSTQVPFPNRLNIWRSLSLKLSRNRRLCSNWFLTWTPKSINMQPISRNTSINSLILHIGVSIWPLNSLRFRKWESRKEVFLKLPMVLFRKLILKKSMLSAKGIIFSIKNLTCFVQNRWRKKGTNELPYASKKYSKLNKDR
jgi:hypothetical protein